MTRITLLALAILCTLFSCQPEEFDFENVNVVVDEAPISPGKTPQLDNVHPSILQSRWWQAMSPSSQRLVGPELSREVYPITLSELQARMKHAQTLVAQRAPACPGFPANPAGDVTLNSQADVDAFGALNCKVIVGALVVEDTLGPDPICDLTPLKGIKEIGSSLSVIADCLTTLDGLEKLKSVGELGPFGFVGVIGANLVDVEALKKLSTVTGSINVINCTQLTSVTAAFSKITTIDTGKTTVPLTSIFVLNVDSNPALTDISGFGNLTHIEGGLRILFNGALQDLDDLSALNTVGDDIFVVGNTAIQNVDELSNINSLQEDLFVFDNPALTQCCGLYNLLCANPPSCTSNNVGGAVILGTNGAGCTEADIVAGGPCP